MNNNKTALIAMVFMAALSLTALSAVSFVMSASARGATGAPPAVSTCGAIQGAGAGGCAQDLKPTPSSHPTGSG
jgi:hypothetical protein